ncbi:phospholipase D2 [Sitophilus oryzae]|uniref:Phospholipase n=1 Tax=Sitophilus oryzae TaxID=7048 RepID=A0A6J2X8K1_SITOR|nr:phospholipase D2 [Sitophilus oryzae]XP_030747184.1 phospholipase D2 [Sitophilus oryzae]XP_030747186.1 phospholipase D2 [Sitophilus oryzae]XP_030747187.1 phospholipase D2 [Sitophilus oryzae]
MDPDTSGRLSPTVSLPRESIGSDADYDDKLGVPETIKIVDVGDGPVAIENSDDELQDEDSEGGLPFTKIHNYIKFKSLNRLVFVPGEDVIVNLVDYERHLTTHMINPNLYTLSVTHAGFNWRIKKRYKDVQNLHQELVLFKTSLNIPFPSKTHKNKIKSFKENVPINKKGKRKGALPRFPKKPELLVSFEKIPNRMKQIEDYLNNLLSIPIYKNHPATLNFFEISHLSFIKDLGLKGKEGLLKKKSGSTNPGQSGCNIFGCYNCLCCLRCQHYCRNFICSRWIQRWFFLKDSCFGYINPKTGHISSVILYDQGFEVATGMYSMPLDTGFQVQTLGRSLTFKCHTRRTSKEWVEYLKQVAETTARDFIQPNPHRSFAPIRNNTSATWFVDGSSYMSSVADLLEQAKEEIYITDWWLSPQIYLKRPAISGDYWRLDKLLQRKAESGVKVYILLYKEVELALGLNSFYSKQTLQDLHKNIKVLRHPDHAKVGVFLWAHHEKIVVIDQTYAFVGGIDLCYGRWDDENHRLTDLGSMTPAVDVSTLRKRTSSRTAGDIIYPIPVPYYKRSPLPTHEESQNVVMEQAPNPDDLPKLNPGDQLLMPHNTSIKPNTPDAERKNIFGDIKDKVKSKGKELINLVYTASEDEVFTSEDELENDDKSGKINLETPEQFIDALNGSAKFWVGKDYVNFIVKDFTNLDSPFDDFIDRVTTPRMPWHDIAVCLYGPAARDVGRHFIQRWNATKLEKAKSNSAYPYLLPKSYNDFKTLPITFPNKTYNVTCQVLRSISTWSGGFLEPDYVEQSIHEAYIETITRAQHYVYIENQFFITLAYNNLNTKNQIGEALYKRIIRAYKEKATFRVYVVMPLLPGFEGEVGGATGTSLHAITHWNYASISSGRDAILNRLKDAGIEDPSEYISFYGLRNHSRLNSEPITELIYVHSKLMIVDDKIVICGSANINDRSMIGKRDSEVAVIIEDEAFEDGIMNGNPYPCGLYAGSLRKYLFKEHLGLFDDDNDTVDFDVADPISDYFYREGWYKIASLNTELYEKVFHVIPSDSVETFQDLRRNNEIKPLWVDELSRAEKMLEDIRGHLVFLPLNFLSKENLTPAAASVEGIMPTSLWT